MAVVLAGLHIASTRPARAPVYLRQLFR
jgi:hypothetical protein